MYSVTFQCFSKLCIWFAMPNKKCRAKVTGDGDQKPIIKSIGQPISSFNIIITKTVPSCVLRFCSESRKLNIFESGNLRSFAWILPNFGRQLSVTLIWNRLLTGRIPSDFVELHFIRRTIKLSYEVDKNAMVLRRRSYFMESTVGMEALNRWRFNFQRAYQLLSVLLFWRLSNQTRPALEYAFQCSEWRIFENVPSVRP